MANWQRVMPLVRHESCLAIWKTACHFLRQSHGESAIFHSMSKAHRHLDIFNRESPRLRINLRIDHHSFR